MIFLNSASSAAALVFYLPGVCTHTDTEGKQRKARVRNILKSSEKNTIFNEHPVYKCDDRMMKDVFLNFRQEGGNMYAIKIIDKKALKGKEDSLENEIRVLKR